MSINRCAVSLTAAALMAVIPAKLQATPYASGITNDSNTVKFYLNESGGDVVVTYNDGSTNANFNGITTGTNAPSGVYTFSLTGFTSYSIAVTKLGSGVAGLETNVIQNTN
ncbi:MAG TPA: hypothetical protein VH251_06705, partial [Verrucomicrobiae bacterium]|nr:hypothetical protein [Verrucomicrobiae bacterium]